MSGSWYDEDNGWGYWNAVSGRWATPEEILDYIENMPAQYITFDFNHMWGTTTLTKKSRKCEYCGRMPEDNKHVCRGCGAPLE